jgi:uncharacterized protein
MSTVPERFTNIARIDALLRSAHRLAIVGLSADPLKASHFVARYMQHEGYRIIPVSPRGGEMVGEPVYPDLAAVPEPVDIVVAFRPAKDCVALASAAVAAKAKAFWMQLGIYSEEAANIAEAGGLMVVADKCIKMEHGRLRGSLHWAGMDTGTISAKKRRLD